jgi:hypothetical protein
MEPRGGTLTEPSLQLLTMKVDHLGHSRGSGGWGCANSLVGDEILGRWTAEYFLLRGYGRLDAFPADGIGAQNGLQRWLVLKEPLDYERTRDILQRWQPYSGLVYLHLLLKHLDEKGVIANSTA